MYAATKTEEFAGNLCEIMHGSCPTTFESNCYSAKKINSCVNDLLSLPVADENGKLDGKSYGCRVIHSFFARTNADHCPHVSFLPEYDVNCLLKCQKSKGVTNEDLFHPVELGAFAQLGVTLGLGLEQWKVRDE